MTAAMVGCAADQEVQVRAEVQVQAEGEGEGPGSGSPVEVWGEGTTLSAEPEQLTFELAQLDDVPPSLEFVVHNPSPVTVGALAVGAVWGPFRVRPVASEVLGPHGDVAFVAELATDSIGVFEGSVQISSEAGPVEVGLVGSVAGPPPRLVAVLAPEPGFVLGADGRATLVAQVEPYVLGPAGLRVEWHSSLDGLLATASVDEDDLSTVDATLSPGTHTLRAVVLDDFDQSDERALFGQACGWSHTEDLDTPPDPELWSLLGDATWVSDGFVELTPDAASQTGGLVVRAQPFDLAHVDLSFGMAVSGPFGADGLAASLYRADAMVPGDDAYLGEGGSALGYGGALACSAEGQSAYHVELDTYENPGAGLPTDHVAVHTQCETRDPLAWGAGGFGDGAWHHVEVETRGGKATVYLDGDRVIEATDVAVGSGLGVLVFSAATGGLTNAHRIDQVELGLACGP